MNNIQKSFVGGLDFISSDTNISDTGYAWLINARQRFGFIEPNKKNVLLNTPSGILQDSISVGNILIIFVSGKAYYQEDGSTLWIQIPGFQMDPDQPVYYTCAVPASTFDYVRKLDVGLSIHAPILATTDFKVAGTPSGIVVQDTINQPWIIEFDPVNQFFTSRVTKTYGEWANISLGANDREYVPIGKQMMYKDGILYIVAPDAKSVYRSVTGRPLDFMINVDENGNKLPTESAGGVTTTSFAMDFDEITCISELDVPGSFIYGTKKNTRIVTTDFTTTIFGEPLFAVSALIKGSGINNQNSFSEALNDYVFISADSAKSFNAVQQLKFKGNSSIFSKNLARLIFNSKTKKPIKQVDCSCIGYNNYVLFNLDTIWGNLIAVYDILLESWVALDITEAVRIKKFTLVETASEIKLYCITQYNKLYQLYASDAEYEIPELRVRGYVADQTIIEHKSAHIRPFFNGGTYDGKVFLTELVDDQISPDPTSNDDYRYSHDLKAAVGGVAYPVIPPVMPSNLQHVDCPGFSVTRGLNGKKLSFILAWTNDAQLIELQVTSSEQAGMTTGKQKDLTYKETYGDNS